MTKLAYILIALTLGSTLDAQTIRRRPPTYYNPGGGGFSCGTQTAADDFNRANGGLGTNWTTLPSPYGAPQIVGELVQIASVGTDVAAYYNAVTFDADQFGQVVLTTANTDANKALIILLRCNTAGQQIFYRFRITGPLGGTCATQIAYVNVSVTQISAGTTTINAGDVMCATAVGTTLTMYVNGTSVLSGTHSTLTAGAVGISLYNDTGGTAADVQLDDFVAGSVP